jgi:prolipoprotein diacylglyceryltransferase
MLDPSGQLAAAQLAIYPFLIIPAAYTLIKHGVPGLFGWFFLISFCFLRIIGSALEVSDEIRGTTNTTAQTINGVALSPLILVFVGVLHES